MGDPACHPRPLQPLVLWLGGSAPACLCWARTVQAGLNALPSKHRGSQQEAAHAKGRKKEKGLREQGWRSWALR